jgi:predicted XRE-type DNA-binding protein
MIEDKIEAHVSSGNIFDDLGHSNPVEAQAKSDLAMQIYKIIEKKELAETAAADLLGIDLPKVSEIIRGKLSKYSIDSLVRFLKLLGNDM